MLSAIRKEAFGDVAKYKFFSTNGLNTICVSYITLVGSDGGGL